MARFTTDNTEGYSTSDLRILNAAWDSLPISVADDGTIDAKSVCDHVAERLLADFDSGLRGKRLTASYYRVADGI